MQRYKCIISYDGTFFAGYQVQPDKRTVQLEFEKALQQMHKGAEVKVTASGRTDAGVHAKGQVLHFDSPYSFPLVNWQKGLNALLPDDIAVVHIEMASSDFHARYHTAGKEYRYMVNRSQVKDPFLRNYSYHYPYSLNEAAIREAISYLIGTHDFTSFCVGKTEVKDKVRKIYEIDFSVKNDMLVFRFVGNGFLYNMVRILAGTLLQVGNGKISPSDIPVIIAEKNRSAAGKTAPSQGLYLWEVHYDEIT